MNSQSPHEARELTPQCPEKNCGRHFKVNNEVFQTTDSGHRARTAARPGGIVLPT